MGVCPCASATPSALYKPKPRTRPSIVRGNGKQGEPPRRGAGADSAEADAFATESSAMQRSCMDVHDLNKHSAGRRVRLDDQTKHLGYMRAPPKPGVGIRVSL